jgi:hypothetical protein
LSLEGDEEREREDDGNLIRNCEMLESSTFNFFPFQHTQSINKASSSPENEKKKVQNQIFEYLNLKTF